MAVAQISCLGLRPWRFADGSRLTQIFFRCYKLDLRYYISFGWPYGTPVFYYGGSLPGVK